MSFFARFIDHELLKLARPARATDFSVVSKAFPAFRFPDFFYAAQAFVKQHELKGKIESTHYHDLQAILKQQFHDTVSRNVNSGGRRMIAVDCDSEETFPDDCFWVFRGANGLVAILRVRAPQKTQVELAVNRPEAIPKIFAAIGDLSVEHSIYRNKLFQVDVPAAITDEYGEVSRPDELTVTFRGDPGVTADNIVLDPATAPVLERTVVRFHQMRDQLRELGVPLQRGILLYGPPGTGKTYTCQYLYSQLKPVTMIVVAGKCLTEVKSICNFARTLQPTVVVLEDVDLIFASREINLYSTGLGEMMDELDGFQNDDAVTFILTTNAIERLEQAIKDRPGRISQCVYFGPPTQELRERYLERFLRTYDTAGLCLKSVAEICDGSSQAFLQELVHRAVQIGVEARQDPSENLRLKFEHFKEAVDEMTRFSEEATGNIVGFHAKNKR